jgi:hypothetical protein
MRSSLLLAARLACMREVGRAFVDLIITRPGEDVIAPQRGEEHDFGGVD